MIGILREWNGMRVTRDNLRLQAINVINDLFGVRPVVWLLCIWIDRKGEIFLSLQVQGPGQVLTGAFGVRGDEG